MGLDVVELIMRVEEEFEIEIGDEEAEQVSTAGQLSQLIGWKLGAHESQGCQSSAAFYQTRRDLMALTLAPRSQIRPCTSLAQIFPLHKRREQWTEIGARTGAFLPDLWLPTGLRWAISGGFFGSALLGFFLFAPDSPLAFVAPFVLGLLFLVASLPLAKPYAREFPASCQTAGQLSQIVLVSRFKSSPQQPVSVGQADIWQRTRALIADELSLPLEQVTPESDFIRDLGAD